MPDTNPNPRNRPFPDHRWGWTLVVNPDGTTTAWNKDKTKTLHSHGPPARAG
jgi:hypothetical protein